MIIVLKQEAKTEDVARIEKTIENGRSFLMLVGRCPWHLV